MAFDGKQHKAIWRIHKTLIKTTCAFSRQIETQRYIVFERFKANLKNILIDDSPLCDHLHHKQFHKKALDFYPQCIQQSLGNG